MSADSGCVDEISFVLEKRGDVSEELSGESVYPREGIFEVSRLLPNARSPQHDFVYLCEGGVRKMCGHIKALVQTCLSRGAPVE